MTRTPPPVAIGLVALRRFVLDVLARYDVPPVDAGLVADCLLRADLRGVHTHGLVRLPPYVERLETGLVVARPELRVERPTLWSRVVDGGNGLGAVVASCAMQAALEAARSFGIGAATARRSNHFGAAAIYALQAVEHDCIGIALTPASRSLAPYGSRAPLLGTNPIAVAVPAGPDRAPWVLDMASSIAARGHVRLAALRGEPIPEGWALDDAGRPTTDPATALRGVMLPFAGPKGSGLAMLIDILGGVLSGSGFAGDIRDMTRDFEAPQEVGHFFLAFKIEAFMPLADFEQRMALLIKRLKALPPAAGFEEVTYPGEREARLELARRDTGIPLPAETVGALSDLAQRFELELPG